ncbi:hypothetical protein FHR71_001572 [Methylobacterium sp. RAS18]|nr:hypothetical protein [Methylobacterium sp. RAS18]
MVKQIKLAIFCELREAVRDTRRPGATPRRFYGGRYITSSEDLLLPDTWGAQVTLTLTVDEATKFAPGFGFNEVDKSFSFGLGGNLSSQAVRIDTYDSFYTVYDLATVFDERKQICNNPPSNLGPRNTTSPFFVYSDLGIRSWLPQAAATNNFIRSSRRASNGEGPPLTSGSFASDAISYDIKFVVDTNIGATPTWTLKRFNSQSTLSLSRTRTHQLLVTLGPAETETIKGRKGALIVGSALSPRSNNIHFSRQIGDAVGQALQSARINQ